MEKVEIICPACDEHYGIIVEEGKTDVPFCPFCGTHIADQLDDDGEE